MWYIIHYHIEGSHTPVRDDPKLLDDSGKIPKADEVVGDLTPNYEIFSLLDMKNSKVAVHLLCS